MTSRRADALALLTLALLATLFFADVLAGVNGFFARDLARYYYPAKQILRDVVLHGEFPYWNRFFSGGQPMAANPEHEVFYPLTWLILLPSYDLGFRLLILVHVYIALFAMYALLRSMTLAPFPAWFGAIAWGLGGLYLSYVNLLPILFSAAWLPLTCLFARRFLREGRARDFALAALVLGLQFLAGEPTTVIQTGMLIGIYALYRGWRSVPRVAAISLAGFAVGAVQMLPALDHVRDSARAHPLDYDLVSMWSLPWARLAELFYPNVLGHVGAWYWGGRLYPRAFSPFLFSIYAGVLVAALAVAGVLVRARGARLVLILCALSLLLALGSHTPLLLWLYRAHLFSSTRYPEKFALLGIFAIIVFAARMLERLMQGDERLRARTIAVLGVVTGIAIAMTVVAFTPFYQRMLAEIWGMGVPDIAARTAEISRADWLEAVIRGLLAIAVVWFAAHRNRRIWIVAAASFVAADLAWTLEEINPRMPRRFFDPPPLASVLPPNRDAFRLFHEADWYRHDRPPAVRWFPPGPWNVWTLRNGLFPMFPASARIQTVLQDDYDKTDLLPSHELTAAMQEVQRSGRPDWYEPFMAMSNAWFRAVYRDFGAEARRSGGDIAKMKPVVFVATAHYPRYYFADQIIGVRGRADVVAHLTTHRTSPRVAFVEGALFAPAPGIVRDVAERANSASMAVECAGQCFLVMSVTRHKDWDVRVDGRRVVPLATNLAYQGIAVPAGRHSVTMRYRNPLVPLGAGVSGIVTALLIFVAIRNNRRP